MGKVTARQLLKMKRAGEKITMVTAYDYPGARLADEAGVENSSGRRQPGHGGPGLRDHPWKLPWSRWSTTQRRWRGCKMRWSSRTCLFFLTRSHRKKPCATPAGWSGRARGAVKLEGGREVTAAVKDHRSRDSGHGASRVYAPVDS